MKKKPKRKADLFHDLPAAEEESPEEPDFRLRGLYLILGAVVVGSILVDVLFSELEWVDRYTPNVATEGIGILLTLVFVQRFLQRQERARRLRGSIGALRKGSRAMALMAWTWAEIIRASLRRAPTTPPATLNDLLSGHLTEDLANWDPRTSRVAEDGLSEPFGRWATRRFHEAQEALNEIIVAYGGSLDPLYVEAIDELVDDSFLRLIRDAVERPPEPREWRQRLNAARAHREAHFHRLLRAISVQNELANEAGQLRSRRTAPRTGSIGLKLELDHDLKVHTRIDARWWWNQPVPGSSA